MTGEVEIPRRNEVAVRERGWFRDPSGRHEFRYRDGRVWTKQVADSDRAPAMAPDRPLGRWRRGWIVFGWLVAILGVCLLLWALTSLHGSDGSTAVIEGGGGQEPSGGGISDVAAMIKSVAALITAVTGLITVFVNLRKSSASPNFSTSEGKDAT
jgi:uncharacterized protein DUF2510